MGKKEPRHLPRFNPYCEVSARKLGTLRQGRPKSFFPTEQRTDAMALLFFEPPPHLIMRPFLWRYWTFPSCALSLPWLTAGQGIFGPWDDACFLRHRRSSLGVHLSRSALFPPVGNVFLLLCGRRPTLRAMKFVVDRELYFQVGSNEGEFLCDAPTPPPGVSFPRFFPFRLQLIIFDPRLNVFL